MPWRCEGSPASPAGSCTLKFASRTASSCLPIRLRNGHPRPPPFTSTSETSTSLTERRSQREPSRCKSPSREKTRTSEVGSWTLAGSLGGSPRRWLSPLAKLSDQRGVVGGLVRPVEPLHRRAASTPPVTPRDPIEPHRRALLHPFHPSLRDHLPE